MRDRRLNEKHDDPNHASFEIVRDRRLNEKPDDPNHASFEIVRDWRLNEKPDDPNHASFEIVRDRRLKGPGAKYARGLSALSVTTSHPRSGQKPRVQRPRRVDHAWYKAVQYITGMVYVQE